MSAREDLFGFVDVGADEEDLPTFAAALDAYRDEVLREAAEKIREDRDRQAAPGQYSVGMSRAAFLIDPDNEKP